eukprot:gene12128-biopygen1758
MACVHIFVAASGGEWGPVVRRGLAPYAMAAKKMLDRMDYFVGALRQSSHSWSVANRVCDILTDNCPGQSMAWRDSPVRIILHATGQAKDHHAPRLLRRQLRELSRRALATFSNSGWRAKLELDPKHIIWNNGRIRASQRMWAEKLGCGRLPDLVQRCHRHNIADTSLQRCLLCGEARDTRLHWCTRCPGDPDRTLAFLRNKWKTAIHGIFPKNGMPPKISGKFLVEWVRQEISGEFHVWTALAKRCGAWTQGMWKEDGDEEKEEQGDMEPLVLAAGGVMTATVARCVRGPGPAGKAMSHKKQIDLAVAISIRYAFKIWQERRQMNLVSYQYNDTI